MKTSDFVKTYYPFAKQTEIKTGMSAIAILAQAALESGWGRVAPGNMLFGVKDTDGVNGNEQLLVTTEYSRRIDVKFPEIISVKPVVKNGVKMFKYTIRDYFRKYNSPEESFTDHARFLLKNPRYTAALKVKQDPIAFVKAIAAAGYATDPNYAKTLVSIIGMIQKEVGKLKL